MKKLFLLLMAVMLTTVTGLAQVIHGTVVSAADDEPLVGASIVTKGSGATVTDIDGKFAIHVAPGTEITVSYVGYATQTLPAAEGMVVKLAQAENTLDAIVVTGYGSGKKLGSIVGSVAVVGDKVFEETPASNFIDALQGQVSGLAINSNSGDPSSTNNSIILRGRNGLNTDSSPLFICDGAPVSESFFTSMNPSDIESVTVLKDASSIAIYGSRGANGIILITTKRGKFHSNATATIRASYGWSSMVGDRVDMMNSEQYMRFRDMINQPLSSEIKDLINNYGISTNWRDEIFNSSAPTYNIEAQVSGGTDAVRYYMSLSHFDQQGIIENSGMRRTALDFNIDSKVNDWFRVGMSGNLGYRRSRTNGETVEASDLLYPNNPMILSRIALPFDSPNYYSFNDNGDIVYGDRSAMIHYSGITMPWYIYSFDHYYQDRITGNVRVYEQITPIKGLVLKAQQALEGYDARRHESVDPRETWTTPMGDKIGQNQNGYINPGSNAESFSRYYQFTYTNTAQYTFDIAEKNHFSVLVGQESIISRSNGFGVSTSGTTDIRLNNLNQGTTVSMSNISYSKVEQVINSYFGNLTYDWNDRYFLDASFRRDGTSQLAPGHRWGSFWAFGVMWNLKNDPITKLQNATWLNDLRLHYSYGVSGNSNIGNFAWMGTVGTLKGGYAGNTATGIGNAPNYDLTWEKVWNHDLGVDVRVFDRLSVKLDWYRKMTTDMLYQIPYSITVGASTGFGNVCKMSNTGIEVDVRGDIYKSKDWYVGANVNFNYNRNRIEELWDGTDCYPLASTGLALKTGMVSNQYYLVRYVGVDPADGKQMWLDKNDNITKEFPSDAQVLTGMSSFAPWVGGFGLNASWKGLSLSANFAWQSGKWVINNDKYFITNSAQGASFNQTVDMLNMWTTPGQVTDIPALGEELHLGDDTSWLENASFCRMKNLTVAYDFPSKLVNKWGLKGLQLHFTGRNLLTFMSSDFKGYDPEPNTNMIQFEYPNTRQYEFGIEVSF